jgi:oligopeptide transport system permease protein
MILYSAARDGLADDIAAEALAGKTHSLTRDALHRLVRNRLAAFSLILVGLLLAAALLGPLFLSYNHEDPDWAAFRAPPSIESGHYFGTDQNGRDLAARTLHGARVSFAVAAVATLVSIVIGVLYGAISGYLGGRIDAAMMRFVDIMYALPYILFVILLMVVFGRNIYLLFAAIGAIEWLTMARIVRGQTLSLKQSEFIEAARASGQKPFWIIVRHIIPNLTGPVVIYGALTIPEIIVTESFLSYLGFGVQEPLTSLGTLISEGADSFETMPWLIGFPAVFLVLLLLGLLFLGDGLRDAFDPKDR